MNDKKFILTVMAVFASLTMAVTVFNYWIDPLWHYGHAHAFNDVQVVTDEREQKTANQLYVQNTADSLLIGSSRSTYVPPSSFQEWDVYNYSVSNLSMREYHTMILFAFKQNPELERIILGVDFFKSSTQEAGAPRSILNHEKKVQQPFYRIKNLLSLDVFEYSLGNFKLSIDNEITEERLYNREGDAFALKLSSEEIFNQTESKITKFENTFYGESYEYFPLYKEIMTRVRDTYPEAEKVVYTTPISTELFKALVNTELFDEYEVWLRDLVEVYGGVWNFMYPNEVTNDITNYFDGHHFYPEVGDRIAKTIESGNPTGDFGTYITEDTIDEHLQDIRELVDQ